jgi:hypothetical protein
MLDIPASAILSASNDNPNLPQHALELGVMQPGGKNLYLYNAIMH